MITFNYIRLLQSRLKRDWSMKAPKKGALGKDLGVASKR